MVKTHWIVLLGVAVGVGIAGVGLLRDEIAETRLQKLDIAELPGAVEQAKKITEAAKSHKLKDFTILCAVPMNPELTVYRQDLAALSREIDFEHLLEATCYENDPERKSLFFPLRSGGKVQFVLVEKNGQWLFFSCYCFGK